MLRRLGQRIGRHLRWTVALTGFASLAIWFALGGTRARTERVEGVDLLPTNFTFTPTTVPDGSSITFNFTVLNQGNTSAAETTTRIVNIVAGGPALCGPISLSVFTEVQTPPLAPGESTFQSVSLTLPFAGSPYPRTLQVGVLVDQFGVAGEEPIAQCNNLLVSSQPLIITDPAATPTPTATPTPSPTPTSTPSPSPIENREFPILNGSSNEPSIAVDPSQPLHAVVGFNEPIIDGIQLRWAETFDGGMSWSSGVLSFPLDFRPFGDPWIRYSSTGELFYSGIAVTSFKNPGKNPFFWKRSWGIFVATSSSGSASASDFGPAKVVSQGDEVCRPRLNIGEICSEKKPDGQSPDHPALTILRRANGGLRLVVAWIDFFNPTDNQFLQIAFSDNNGLTWSAPKTVAGPKANAIALGGNESQIAVSWWDSLEGAIKLRTSIDAESWSPTTKLAEANTSSLVDGLSTTDKVLSEPYAMVVPSPQGGLRAIWQTRLSGKSQVFYADSLDNWLPHILGLQDVEKFLPGGGRCESLVGAYTQSGPNTFRYTVWLSEPNRVFTQLFVSGSDLNGENGYVDRDFRLKRIGDYTGVDCAGNVGWAAWTDVRSGVPEVWGAVFPINR